MNIAAQTSVGGRDLVLENGPHTMNSDDEESVKEEHGDVLTGVYTNGLKAPVILSQSEVARQKAAASYAKSVGYGAWIDSGSNHPSADSGFSDSDISRSQSPILPASSMGGSRFETSGPADSSQPTRSNPFVPRSSTPTGNAPSRPPTPKESAPPRGATPVSTPPRAATPISVPPDPPSPKRPGKPKGTGKKAACRSRSSPPNGYPSKSEQSWKLARCGRLRGNGYVCCKWQPFQDLRRDLFLRGGFSPHPNSAGSMDQRSLVTRYSERGRRHAPLRPGPRAVVRCSRASRWGQTK
jgi:hypothetical protein